jgi:XTP/dITP diphosphohydrolase
MILYACSTNPGKLREFELADCGAAAILLLPGLREIPAPEENGATFEENARIKSIYYSSFTSKLVFADDSGLEVDALGGAPGVYSARYAGPHATDAQNNSLLLGNLAHADNRTARFVCVIAVARAGEVLETVRGTVEGEILRGPRGTGGFGYDPLFFYKPFGCSLAEVEARRKFEVSHRGQALRSLCAWAAQSISKEKLPRGSN